MFMDTGAANRRVHANLAGGMAMAGVVGYMVSDAALTVMRNHLINVTHQFQHDGRTGFLLLQRYSLVLIAILCLLNALMGRRHSPDIPVFIFVIAAILCGIAESFTHKISKAEKIGLGPRRYHAAYNSMFASLLIFLCIFGYIGYAYMDSILLNGEKILNQTSEYVVFTLSPLPGKFFSWMLSSQIISWLWEHTLLLIWNALGDWMAVVFKNGSHEMIKAFQAIFQPKAEGYQEVNGFLAFLIVVAIICVTGYIFLAVPIWLLGRIFLDEGIEIAAKQSYDENDELSNKMITAIMKSHGEIAKNIDRTTLHEKCKALYVAWAQDQVKTPLSRDIFLTVAFTGVYFILMLLIDAGMKAVFS